MLRGGEACWLVDARSSALHLAELGEAGWTRAVIVEATGISRATLQRIASHRELRIRSTVRDALARLS